MQTSSKSNGAAILSNPTLRMDCRIKSGNDGVRNHAWSSNLVIARSDSDEAIQILARACWIASLTLAMTRKRHRSRGAYASEFCLRRRTKNRFAPGIRMIPKSGVRFSDKIMRRKREAKRRKAHANHSAPHQQTSPFADASGAAARHVGARPAFRRYAAALARANASAVGSAPVPAFPETRPGGCYPRQPVTSLPSSSETGHHAGRAVAQSRPRAKRISSARGHRTRSVLRKCPRERRPSMSEVRQSCYVNCD